MTRFQAKPASKKRLEIEWWSSLWCDLLHADVALEERSQLSGPRHEFARRALLEAAIIAYGRAAGNGRRQIQIAPLVNQLDEDQQDAIAEVIHWRNKHVAHRVDDGLERVEATVIFDGSTHEDFGMQIVVSPVTALPASTLGPFASAAKDLRDMVWQQRIHPLEAEILAEEDIGALVATAQIWRPDGQRSGVAVRPSRGD